MDNVSLSFSQEEVVLILKLLGTDSIPGVGQHPFGDVAQDVEQHLLASAERTLRARAMISIDGELINIDQLVVALIGTCAVPRFSWLVTRTLPKQLPENRFYHITPSMFVEHIISGPGIHTFTAIATQAQTIERLTNFWQLHGHDGAHESLLMPTEAMQTMLEELMFAEAAQTSATLSLPEPIIAVNTIALIDHEAHAGEALYRAPQNSPPMSAKLDGATSTSFIQCPSSLWQSMSHDNGQVELRSISANIVGEQISAWQALRWEKHSH